MSWTETVKRVQIYAVTWVTCTAKVSSSRFNYGTSHLTEFLHPCFWFEGHMGPKLSSVTPSVIFLWDRSNFSLVIYIHPLISFRTECMQCTHVKCTIFLFISERYPTVEPKFLSLSHTMSLVRVEWCTPVWSTHAVVCTHPEDLNASVIKLDKFITRVWFMKHHPEMSVCFGVWVQISHWPWCLCRCTVYVSVWNRLSCFTATNFGIYRLFATSDFHSHDMIFGSWMNIIYIVNHIYFIIYFQYTLLQWNTCFNRTYKRHNYLNKHNCCTHFVQQQEVVISTMFQIQVYYCKTYLPRFREYFHFCFVKYLSRWKMFQFLCTVSHS
jgi:hypothetical protein